MSKDTGTPCHSPSLSLSLCVFSLSLSRSLSLFLSFSLVLNLILSLSLFSEPSSKWPGTTACVVVPLELWPHYHTISEPWPYNKDNADPMAGLEREREREEGESSVPNGRTWCPRRADDSRWGPVPVQVPRSSGCLAFRPRRRLGRELALDRRQGSR